MGTRIWAWVVLIVALGSGCMGRTHFMGPTYGDIIDPLALLSATVPATSTWSTVSTSSSSSFGRTASQTQRHTSRFDCADQAVGAAFEHIETLLREDLFGAGYQVDPKRESSFDTERFVGKARILYSTSDLDGELRLDVARETSGPGFELQWFLTESSR